MNRVILNRLREREGKMNRVIWTDRDGEGDLNRLREREGKMNRVIWTD